MEFIFFMFNKKALHHAYLIEGNRESVESNLKPSLTETLDISMEGNPDFLHMELDLFSINDARRLADFQSKRALVEGRKVIIVSFDRIIHETQNALLKVLEEPTEGTHIFLVTPTLAGFLPTLLSRVEVIKKEEGRIEDKEGAENAKHFLQSSPAERIKTVKKIADSKNKQQARAFLNGLERELYSQGIQNNQSSLKQILFAQKYLHDRGSSIKQLLEHIALSV